MSQIQSAPYILFDFVDENRVKQRKIFKDPIEIVTALSPSEVKPALKRIQEAVKRGYYAVGYLSYEAAPAFDSAFNVHPNVVMPLVWFGIFAQYETDHECSEGNYRISEWKPTLTEESYHESIHQIHEAIARGDTYQVNYTMRLRSHFEGDSYALYTRLCDAQQADFSAMLQLGDFSILSASPELFFRKIGNQIITRPMKGTVKRGLWQEQDELLSKWLHQSVKNRAENVMITDLLRNDLSLIAETGSVHVPSLFDIEKYYTLFQMTSTVTANIRPDVEMSDIFAALFPCGSITGAPKISTMNLIHELEHTPREIYCGSIGMMSPDGSAIFNVAIRTVWIDHRSGQAEYGVGGGITWDSTASDEYEEAKTKALLLTEVKPKFELLESLRLENGTYTMLDEHIARMLDSALYLDFKANSEEIRKALIQHAQHHPAGLRKVRLLLSRSGSISVNSATITDFEGKLTVSIAEHPVPSNHRFLYHKTTHRTMYDKHRNQNDHAYDVLLWNEKGELTEFTTGNVVVELEGKRYTPRRESGLLAGVLRNQLLADGIIAERVLTLDDVTHASQIWLINSVRGWLPVQLTEDGMHASARNNLFNLTVG
ncbi:aminodeoxychorismate synthase component I [Paenibacillus sp. 481]|uniref:aminodeoxychorismate synthase component I n=1 Tax=Paenibacillus sp. 481 TaxID=2835869 RepID=UPI001E495656|nr:aminodeoxychorismate synthase component I [Paenibacillus sp. 481]UHA73336.1 aminodeoxychorismate synthase component I [Paenibacillus sp. 481]